VWNKAEAVAATRDAIRRASAAGPALCHGSHRSATCTKRAHSARHVSHRSATCTKRAQSTRHVTSSGDECRRPSIVTSWAISISRWLSNSVRQLSKLLLHPRNEDYHKSLSLSSRLSPFITGIKPTSSFASVLASQWPASNCF